jgi:hypothetical protein
MEVPQQLSNTLWKKLTMFCQFNFGFFQLIPFGIFLDLYDNLPATFPAAPVAFDLSNMQVFDSFIEAHL